MQAQPQNPERTLAGGHQVYRKGNQQLELLISDKTVEKIMGPEPVPTLDIEMPMIANELQRKMVEEIQCVMCLNFPFQPMECKKCNKLFCKHCQQWLLGGAGKHNEDDFADPEKHKLPKEKMAQMSPAERQSYAAQAYQKTVPGFPNKHITPGYDVCCPNCQERGDFLEPVNKVLRNCIDFCEFPHKCWKDGQEIVLWKTMNELQEHAMYECPKYGCDICYHEDYQHMTRAQLFQHIKRECPEVIVQCQVCERDFKRADFASHECLRDIYLKRLRSHQFDVIDYLAEHLMRLRRSKEGLGLCMRQECVDRFKQSSQYKAGQGMISPNTSNQACKCARCQTVVAGYEDSFFCLYCNETYCPPCLGYVKYFDMEELDLLIQDQLGPAQMNALTSGQGSLGGKKMSTNHQMSK
jgi:hypothetical protein